MPKFKKISKTLFIFSILIFFVISIIESTSIKNNLYLDNNHIKYNSFSTFNKEISSNSEEIPLSNNESIYYDYNNKNWYYFNFEKNYWVELYDIEKLELEYSDFLAVTKYSDNTKLNEVDEYYAGDRLLQFKLSDQINLTNGYGNYCYFDIDKLEFIQNDYSENFIDSITTQNNLNPTTRYETLRMYDSDGRGIFYTGLSIYPNQPFNSQYNTWKLDEIHDNSLNWLPIQEENDTSILIEVETKDLTNDDSVGTPYFNIDFYNENYLIFNYEMHGDNGSGVNNSYFEDNYEKGIFTINWYNRSNDEVEKNKSSTQVSSSNLQSNVYCPYKDVYMWKTNYGANYYLDINLSNITFINENLFVYKDEYSNYSLYMFDPIDKKETHQMQEKPVFITKETSEFDKYAYDEDYFLYSSGTTAYVKTTKKVSNQYLYYDFNSEINFSVINDSQIGGQFLISTKDKKLYLLTPLKNKNKFNEVSLNLFLLDSNFNYSIEHASSKFEIVSNWEGNKNKYVISNPLVKISLTNSKGNAFYYKEGEEYYFETKNSINKNYNQSTILTNQSKIIIENPSDSNLQIKNISLNNIYIPSYEKNKWVINVIDFIDPNKEINELDLKIDIYKNNLFLYEIEYNFLVFNQYEPKISVYDNLESQINSNLYFNQDYSLFLNSYLLTNEQKYSIKFNDDSLINYYKIYDYNYDSKESTYIKTNYIDYNNNEINNYEINFQTNHSYFIEVVDIFNNSWNYLFTNNPNLNINFWSTPDSYKVEDLLKNDGYSLEQIHSFNQNQLQNAISNHYSSIEKISLSEINFDSQKYIKNILEWNKNYLIKNNELKLNTISEFENKEISFYGLIYYTVYHDLWALFWNGDYQYPPNHYAIEWNFKIIFNLESIDDSFSANEGIKITILPSNEYSFFKDSKTIDIYYDWMFEYIDLNQSKNKNIKTNNTNFKSNDNSSLKKTLKKDFKKSSKSNSNDYSIYGDIFWKDFYNWSNWYYQNEIDYFKKQNPELIFVDYFNEIDQWTFRKYFVVDLQIKYTSNEKKIKSIKITINPNHKVDSNNDLFINSTELVFKNNSNIYIAIFSIILIILLILLAIFLYSYFYVKRKSKNLNEDNDFNEDVLVDNNYFSNLFEDDYIPNNLNENNYEGEDFILNNSDFDEDLDNNYL